MDTVFLAAAGLATNEAFLLTVLVQLAVVIAVSHVGGRLFAAIGQPRVVGEIMTGLMLGPSLFGRLAPELSAQLFPSTTSSVFFVLGQIGLIFLMFSIGLEFDFRQLRSVGTTAASVAGCGIAFPFALGAALAWTIHPVFAADVSRGGFVLVLATAMSITAIPILGRMMRDFDIHTTRLGVLTITAAAVDDAIGWILLAGVSAGVRGDFEFGLVLKTFLMTVAFVVVVGASAGWLYRRTIAARVNSGNIGVDIVAAIMVCVLLSAAATNEIGVFSIFGPFVLGAALSSERELQTLVRERIEAFVTPFFLPVFFLYTGLRTDVGSLESATLWVIAVLVIVVATVGKAAGCGLAARFGGLSWAESGCVAVMMNTRALMGLIAINIGRDLGVVPDSVFCMMVLMAIATTITTAPILRVLLKRVESAGQNPIAAN